MTENVTSLLRSLPRYDVVQVCDGDETQGEMTRVDDGDFVRFDDVVALITEQLAKGAGCNG
jgi:hypothetical protein